jgi:hypothetical protein
MIRPAILIGVTAVLCACGGAEQGADAATQPSLFPLEVGRTWQLYDERTGTRTNSLAVVREAEPTGVILRGFPGLPEARVRRNGAAVEAWDPGPGRWEPFLRLGAPAGTGYLVNLSQTLLWRGVHVTVASRNATVADANGRTVRDAVRLTIRAKGKGLADAGLEELVFAPGVGIARIVEMTIAGPRVAVLQRSAGAPTR